MITIMIVHLMVQSVTTYLLAKLYHCCDDLVCKICMNLVNVVLVSSCFTKSQRQIS